MYGLAAVALALAVAAAATAAAAEAEVEMRAYVIYTSKMRTTYSADPAIRDTCIKRTHV